MVFPYRKMNIYIFYKSLTTYIHNVILHGHVSNINVSNINVGTKRFYKPMPCQNITLKLCVLSRPSSVLFYQKYINMSTKLLGVKPCFATRHYTKDSSLIIHFYHIVKHYECSQLTHLLMNKNIDPFTRYVTFRNS